MKVFIWTGTTDTLGRCETCMCKYKYLTKIRADRRTSILDIHTGKLLDAIYRSLFHNKPEEEKTEMAAYARNTRSKNNV